MSRALGGTGTVAFCLALVLALGFLACTRAPRASRALQAGDVIDVLRFDPSRADFYWYGHRLEPPVIFTLAPGGMRANGIAPVVYRPDTTGSSARLAPRFGQIPLVASLVEQGHSYIDALNIIGCMALREPRLSILAYRRHRAEGDSVARAAALAALTPGLCDAAERIEVDANRFACRSATGIPLSIRVPDTANVSLAMDPCGPHSDPDSVLHMREIVKGLQAYFDRLPVVVIATLGGSEALWGEQAVRARREIEAARAAYRQGGTSALDVVATTSIVTRYSLRDIVGAEPAAPRR